MSQEVPDGSKISSINLEKNLKLNCDYCGATYKTLRGITKHSCLKLKLIQETGDVAVVRAFDLFDFWYRYNGFAKRKGKTFSEFTKSPYFKLFVELTTFSDSVYLGSVKEYLRWISDNRIPSNSWKSKSAIEKYRVDAERSGDAEDRVMQTLQKIAVWCDTNKTDMSEFFDKIEPGEAIQWVQTGKMSPWVLLATVKLDNLLLKMSEEQATLLASSFDIDYWTMRANMAKDKFESIKKIISEVGL
jgi:hypothetical protein